jgi:hypothetical protein
VRRRPPHSPRSTHHLIQPLAFPAQAQIFTDLAPYGAVRRDANDRFEQSLKRRVKSKRDSLVNFWTDTNGWLDTSRLY